MAAWLGIHPDIFLSKPKEPGYWITDLPMRGRVATHAEYARCFAGASTERYLLDATPWYFYSPAALRSIAERIPEAQVIVQLRDPVSQVVSLHNHHVFKNLESESDIASALSAPRPDASDDFRSGLDYLDAASAGKHVDRLLDNLPAENVHFVDFDRMRTEPRRVYLELLDNLGVAPIEPPSYPRLNRSRTVRSMRVKDLAHRLAGRGAPRPLRALRHRIDAANTVERDAEVPKAVTKRIASVLASDIDRLGSLLERDLASWKQV